MRLVLLILLTFCATAFAGDQSIYLRSDQTFRGPFTHEEPLLAGESRVTLTAGQYAALDSLRRANPGVVLVFNGSTFSLSPIASIRAALLAEFAGLSPGEQAMYQPALLAVKAMLDAGQVSEARKVIFLSPVPTDDLAAARLRMLALFPAE